MAGPSRVLDERAGGAEADAVAAYQAAIDSDHPDQAPRAMVSVGVLLYRNGSREEGTNTGIERSSVQRSGSW